MGTKTQTSMNKQCDINFWSMRKCGSCQARTHSWAQTRTQSLDYECLEIESRHRNCITCLKNPLCVFETLQLTVKQPSLSHTCVSFFKLFHFWILKKNDSSLFWTLQARSLFIYIFPHSKNFQEAFKRTNS